MKFVNIKIETVEFIINIDFIYFITKEDKYEELGNFNYVKIPDKYNYFLQLKNGEKFKISYEEYERIKKEIL